MRTIKMALLAGAAVAVSAAAAQADELSDLKAQVEALDAKVAAMEAAPAVPAGYQLLAISKGESISVPGLEQSNKERFTEGNRATIISVMPTADAPAGATISWSGYVRAAVVYSGNDLSEKEQRYYKRGNATDWTAGTAAGDSSKYSNNTDDWDVKSRGQLMVSATTDTAVGEVGVMLKMRADFNGNGEPYVYMKEAWGYWSMTPELTFGGGYSGSLGNISYGYDGACTCYYTDNGDVGFNPGDTTQLRLSYASGPFSMGIALEDASNVDPNADFPTLDKRNGNQLGAAGEIKYSGDAFSGEVSGVYRSTNEDDYTVDSNVDGLWQVGVGGAFNLGDMATISLAAAMGAGPYQTVNDNGSITNSLPIYNEWWGVSGLGSAKLSDSVHVEAAAGYKNRNGDDYKTADYDYKGFEYDTYSFLGGLYYTPVDQLTIGLEGEWYTQSWDFERTGTVNEGTPAVAVPVKDTLNVDKDSWTVDLVSVWRF